MTISKMKVFANLKQQKFLNSSAKIKDFLAGRGSAKTDTLGKVVAMMYRDMPRARVALAGATYVTIDTVTLPIILKSLEFMKIYEYTKDNPFGHYVIGKIPPSNWVKPYNKTVLKAFKYCITFINGFTLQLVSQDNAETHRGLNIDGLLVDEGATLKESFIYRILKKAMRGNKFTKISSSRFFECHYTFSSAAWFQEGKHIYRNQDLYDAQTSARINMSQTERKNNPPKYCIVEATCLDNPLAGQEYWDAQKEGEDPLVFDVEVANMRLESIPDGFYHAFRPSHHGYIYAHRYEYDEKTGLHLSLPNDYRADKAIDLTMDFNKSICWLVAIQEIGMESRIINSNFIKPHPSNISTNLVECQADWFIKRYENHPTKELFLYGDPNGAAGNVQATEIDDTPFYTFKKALEKAGWTVHKKWRVTYPSHKKKYMAMNTILAETDPNLPRIRINQHNNKVLIITLQSTGVNEKYKKDKKTEKKQPLAKREYAPDGTDAIDYYYYWKYKDRLPNSSGWNHELHIYRGP